MRNWSPMPFVIVGSVLLIVLSIYAAIRSEEAWNQYADEHHCAAIQHEDYPVTTWIDYGGVLIPTTAYYTQTTYRCDGGEIVKR
jgi:hypothetical protein